MMDTVNRYVVLEPCELGTGSDRRGWQVRTHDGVWAKGPASDPPVRRMARRMARSLADSYGLYSYIDKTNIARHVWTDA